MCTNPHLRKHQFGSRNPFGFSFVLPDPEEGIVAQLLCHTGTLLKQFFTLSAEDLAPHFQRAIHRKGFL
jgi:hypothetical protein